MAGPYLKEHWPTIRTQLLEGIYKPQPVRRGRDTEGVRRHAAAGHSDGARPLHPASSDARCYKRTGTERSPRLSSSFRPGRSAHQAVEQAQMEASGYTVVVDIDLEKFFDRVNHDIL